MLVGVHIILLKNELSASNLPVFPSNHFQVIFGNSDQLECNSQCLNIPVLLKGTPLFINFFILTISEANLVLSVQRLKTLGPIIIDYSTLRCSFRGIIKPYSCRGCPIRAYKKCPPNKCSGYRLLTLSLSSILSSYTQLLTSQTVTLPPFQNLFYPYYQNMNYSFMILLHQLHQGLPITAFIWSLLQVLLRSVHIYILISKNKP